MINLEFDYDYGESCEIAQVGAAWRVKAEQDSDAESPRDWDNVATMVCEHRRYNLGDDDGAAIAQAAVRASRDYRETWEESETGEFRFRGVVRPCLDLSEPADLWQAIQLCSDIVSQPLYLYDHSGITISTGRFACPWDSGQVGFAFVTLETIKREHKWRTMCKPAIAWARRCIDIETETYDDYLTGSVYGFVIERASEWEAGEPSEWEHVDSCWGFYGPDHDKSGLAEAAAGSLKFHLTARPAEIASERESDIGRIRELVANRRTVTGAARDVLQREIAAIAAAVRALNLESRAIGESLN